MASPAPTPTAADLLRQASERLGEVPTVHFVLDVEGDTYIDTAQTIRLLGAEGDLQRPDRVRTTFQAEVMGRAITLQLITVGEQSWTTNILTGEWGEAPFEFAYQPDILFSTQDGIGPVMGRVNDVTLLPDEELDGRAVHHLRATVDEEVVGPLTYFTISGSPVTVDLWIDRETDDLLRARLSEPPGADRPNPAVWTLELAAHGKELVIEPPV
jgi:LppX_LprAFG lipoprotein